MKCFNFFCLLIFVAGISNAQIGINTIDPDPTAILDIKSTNSGLLIPRVALSGPNDTTTIAGDKPESLLIYNTSSAGGLTPGFFYWDGTDSWDKIKTTADDNDDDDDGDDVISQYAFGDIKHSFQPGDHDGWYLLDGRAVGSLSSSAETAANNLGFTSNLPNANNRVLKAKTGSEALGTAVGSNSITLNANNIPQLTGTTNNSGNHSHGFQDSTTSSNNERLRTNGSTSNFSVVNTINNQSKTTNSAGDHNHTVTVGNASPTSINNTPASIVTNVFVYLGE